MRRTKLFQSIDIVLSINKAQIMFVFTYQFVLK